MQKLDHCKNLWIYGMLIFKIQFDLITTVYFYFLFLDYFCTESNEPLKFVYSNCMDTDFETG